MNLLSMINKITCFMMNNNSSVFLGASSESAGSKFLFSLDKLFGKLVTFGGQVLYSLSKWVLYFVDICFFYIQQLAGMNTDTRSLESMISKDSDMVFNLLLSNQELITSIVKRLLALAIVLLLVFSIFAIIKNQFDALKTGNASSAGEVIVSSLKAILLMLITPIIAILGIVASNVLLKSLYYATDVTDSASLGTQVFAAASNSANKYRQYAMSAQRIPILYDFTDEDAKINLYIEQNKGQDLQEYLTSYTNSIYTTYKMFANDNFSTFEEIESNNTNLTNYYATYDRHPSISANASGYLDSCKRIRAYNVEYFVMADIIDYAVTSSAFLHIMTIEELLDNIVKLPNNINKESIFNSVVATYNIELYQSDGVTLVVNPSLDSTYDYYIDKSNWSIIRFTNNYYEPGESGDPIYLKQIQYNHVKSATDEAFGAVFVVAGEQTETYNDGKTKVSVTYNYPVARNYSEAGAKKFESEFIERNKIVVAKGVFNDSGHPTAIKKSNSGNEVLFYRNNLESVVLGKAGEILNSDFKPDETNKEEKSGIFSKLVSFVKSLFDPSKWLPSLNLSEDEVMTSYVKVSVTSGKLDNGELHIGYMFTDGLTSSLSGNTYGLQLYTLFNPQNLNYLVLVFGAYILLRICFLSIFALIKRCYDLVLIIMIFPLTCSTIPIDNGTSYSQWFSSYLSKLLSTYGLLLGINFVLMLFPIINQITFFSAEDLAKNKSAARFSQIFTLKGYGISINTQAKILNFIICILFELVAFSFLESGKDGKPGIYGIIMKLVNPNDKDELYSGNPAGSMLKTAKDAAHMITVAVATPLSLLTNEGRAQLANKLIEKVPLPGKAINKRIAQKNAVLNAMKRVEDLKGGRMSSEDQNKYNWRPNENNNEGT